jgi:hypothetical protein
MWKRGEKHWNCAENTGIVLSFHLQIFSDQIDVPEETTACFFFGWASHMFHKNCSVSVCFHLQYFPLNKLTSTRGFLSLSLPPKGNKKNISGNGSNFHSYSFEGTIKQLCWGVPRCKKSQLWLSNLVLCM